MTEYQHTEALATTEWLADHLDDSPVRVVDMRYNVRIASGGTLQALPGKKGYRKGHIPGAVFVDYVADLSTTEDNVPLNILPPDRFEALMGRLGIDGDTTVVVYDDSEGLWAARLWWALRYYGHDGVKLLNGGLRKWIEEGRPLETGAARVPRRTFRAQVRPELRVTSDQVRRAIGSPEIRIIDALPEAFYTGQARLYPSHRAGHIPAARNLPAPANIDPATRTLLPPDELARLWRRVDLDPHKRAITYCGAGVYGAFDLFVLYVMGYENVGLYDGSWMEWGANPELRVETGPDNKTLGSG